MKMEHKWMSFCDLHIYMMYILILEYACLSVSFTKRPHG